MASSSQQPTPHIDELPGAWIETPADGKNRQQSYTGTRQPPSSSNLTTTTNANKPCDENTGTYLAYNPNQSPEGPVVDNRVSAQFSSSSNSTVVPSPTENDKRVEQEAGRKEDTSSPFAKDKVEDDSEDGGYAAIKPAASAPKRPNLQSRDSRPMTEDDLFKVLSRRRTNLSRTNTAETESSADEEQEEINKLMSRMFGRTRQESSEEEKTRHVGVVFKNLTVKGMGVGAALQPSVGDLFLDIPRFIKNVFTKGPRMSAGKPPVRTILDDFSGCIKPGEMLLVLGR